MRSLKPLIAAIFIFGLTAGAALAQHFEAPEGGQTSHTLLIREATLDGESLIEDDEIAVFTPDGVLAGAMVISEDPPFGVIAIGDNPLTEEMEGFLGGEDFVFRVWDASAEDEFRASAVFESGEEYWEADGFTIFTRLAASSEDQPTIQTSVQEYDFGQVLVDNTVSFTLTVSNVGSDDLVVSDVSSNDEAFDTDFADEVTATPNQSFDLEVSFTPDAEEDFAGVLTIASNDPDNDALEIPLTGTGTADEFAAIELSPGEIDFGEWPVLAAQTRILRITNTGTADLTIDDLGFDDESFYTEWDGEPIVLSPLATTTVEIVFQPAEEIDYEVMLTISSDARDMEEVTVTLLGTGISADRHFFAQATETNHSILVISAMIDGELLVAGDEIGVFTPGGICAGYLRLEDVHPDSVLWYIRYGSGLAAYGRDVDNDISGFRRNELMSFRLWDLSEGEEYMVDAEDVAYGDFPFNRATWLENSVTEVTVDAFREEGPNIAIVPGSLDFGDVFVGESPGFQFRVRNSGGASCRVTNLALSNEDAFTSNFRAGFILKPHTERLFAINFAPEDSILYEETLTIISDVEGEEEIEVPLLGFGRAPLPELQLSESAHDYEVTVIDLGETWEVEMSNLGWFDLEIESVVSDNEFFTTDFPDQGIVLERDESFIMEVRFDPTEETDYEGALTITSNHLNNEGFEHFITLSGTGAFRPHLNVSTDLLDFGPVDYRDQFAEGDELGFTILNDGSSDLVVTDMALDGEGFVFEFGGEFTLAPDEETDFVMGFDPTEVADYSGAITITCNDPETQEFILDLLGSGVYINHAPEVVQDIADQEFDEDFEETQVADLNEVFRDLDEDALEYMAESDNENLHSRITDDGFLMLDAQLNWNGQATVTVSADDGFGAERDAWHGHPARGPVRALRSTSVGQVSVPADHRSLRSTSVGQVSVPAEKLYSGSEDLVWQARRPALLGPRRDDFVDLQFMVTVNPVNDAPVWDDVPEPFTILETETASFTVVSSDVDLDDLILTIDGPEGLEFVDNGDGTGDFVWLPGYDAVGAEEGSHEYTITFTTTDTAQVAVDAEVVITVVHVNRSPQWNPVPQNRFADEGDLVEFDVVGVDPDDDALLIEYRSDDLPDDAEFDYPGQGTGTFTWQTDNEDAGTYTAFFTLSDVREEDGFRLVQPVSITINNINRPPEWTNVPEHVDGAEGTPIDFEVAGMDPDGDRLTIEYLSDDIPDEADFIDRRNGTGRFVWTPTFQDNGDYLMTLILHDLDDTDTAYVTLSVEDFNRPPRWTDIPNAVHSPIGQKMDFTMTGMDPDGDDLAIELSYTDAHLDAADFTDNGDGSGRFEWRVRAADEGAYMAYFTLSDEASAVTDSVILTVGNVNQPPHWTNVPAGVTVNENSFIEFNVVAVDPNEDDITITFNQGDFPEAAALEDNGNGTADFTWQTGFDDAGDYEARFRASDAEWTVIAVVPIHINNVNRPPEFVDLAESFELNETERLIIDIEAMDGDGDAMAITMESDDLPPAAQLADHADGTATFNWLTTYDDAGEYIVTFMVSDDQDITEQDVTITVVNVNRDPFWVDIPDAVETNEGQVLNFRVIAGDLDPESLSLTISGDEVPEGVDFTDHGDRSGSFAWTPPYEYVSADDGSRQFTATFTVTDEGDLTDAVDMVVTVNHVNLTPAWVLPPPATPQIGEGSQLYFGMVASDPDGDAMDINLDPDGLPEGYDHRNYGNGTAEFFWTPGYEDEGEYTVTFTLTDGEFEVDRQSVITVINTNRAPAFTDIPDMVEVDENAELTIAMAGSDPDGDDVEISYTQVDLPDNTDFTDNGDGTATLVWTPSYDEAGEYSATFTITDGDLSTESTVTVVVHHVNRPPEWTNVPESAEGDENEPMQFTVRGSDPDGDGLSIAYSSDDIPDNAGFRDNGDGSGVFTWMPGYDDAGDYTAAFSLSDGTADPVDVEVQVTVNHVNRAPEVSADRMDIDINEDQLVTVVLTGFDPDDDALSMEWESDDLPQNRASLTDNQNDTWTFRWQTNFDDSGEYDLLFRLSDEPGLTDEVAVHVTVNHVNRTPEWVDEVAAQVRGAENQQIQFTLIATDPDDDDLTIEYDQNDLPNEARFVDHGNGTGTFTWRPDFDEAREYRARFTLSDGAFELRRTVRVLVNQVNRAPAWVNVPAEQGGNENTRIEFAIIGADPDNDGLTIEATSDDVPNLEDVFIDLGGGRAVFIWTPNYEQSGEYVVTFTLSDGDLTDEADTRITVNHVNRPPYWGDYPMEPVRVAEGASTMFEVTAWDDDQEDQEDLTIEWNWISEEQIDSILFEDAGMGAGVFGVWPNYGEAGRYEVAFTVSDGVANPVQTGVIAIIVGDVNRAPIVAEPIADLEVDEDFPRRLVANVNNVFTDADDDDLDFDFANGGLVDVEIDNRGRLYITGLLDAFGDTWVAVSASDGEETAIDTFLVSIADVNDPPRNRPPEDGGLPDGFEFLEPIEEFLFGDLNTMFIDPEGDPMFFWFEGGLHLNPDIDLENIFRMFPEEYWWGIERLILFASDEPPEGMSDGSPGKFDLDKWLDGSSDGQPAATDADLGWNSPSGGPRRDEVMFLVITISIANVDDAPIERNELPDLALMEDDDFPYMVGDLDDFMWDPDDGPLAYEVEVDAPLTFDLDAGTNELTLMAPENFNGAGLGVRITATDDSGSVGNADFTVDVIAVNDAPEVVAPLTDMTVTEDSGVITVADLDDVFMDVDGDELSFEVTVDEMIDWAIDGDNVLTLTPVENFSSADGVLVTVTADDGQGGGAVASFHGRSLRSTSNPVAQVSVPAFPSRDGIRRSLRSTFATSTLPNRDDLTSSIFTLTVTPVNDAPMFVDPIGAVAVDEGQMVNFTLAVDDYDLRFEGDEVTLVMSNAAGTGGQFFDNGNLTGTYTWPTTRADAGVYNVQFTVSDLANASVTHTVAITVADVNQAPTLAQGGIPAQTVDEDAMDFALLDLDNYFDDADNDPLSYTATSSDTIVMVSVVDGMLMVNTVENANGIVDIFVTASDGQAEVDAMFTLLVNPVNDLPTAFDLIGPADGSLTSAFPNVQFNWNASSDPVEDSTLTYTLVIRFQGRQLVYDGLAGTEIWVPRANIAETRDHPTVAHWEVWANDGIDSVRSNASFELSVAPLTEREWALIAIPTEVSLWPAFPNPFNAATTIEFGLPEPYQTVLTVHDLAGRLVRTIVDGMLPAGHHYLRWDGLNDAGFTTAAGVYIVRLVTPESTEFITVVRMQ